MKGLRGLLLGSTGILAAGAAAVCCQAQEDAFYERTFQCDASAANSCGTTRDGKPMTCFNMRQLYGKDFCTEACDVEQPPSDPRFQCVATGGVATGALVQICHPGASEPNDGCPAELSCYRTDLLRDEGLCLWMSVCSTDKDCEGNHSACAGRYLGVLYGPNIPTDHLVCLQPECDHNCASGEVCSGDYSFKSTGAPSLCAPECDAAANCPPNFFCLKKAGPAYPNACTPGLLGYRCATDQDCVLGDCVDTGDGFSVCSVGCQEDADCEQFDSLGETVCAEVSPNQRFCVRPVVFTGELCGVDNPVPDADCPPGKHCSFIGPYSSNRGVTGECRWPCDENSRCSPHGGIPHVCVPNAPEGDCYPGIFGVPCNDDSECIVGLHCLSPQVVARGESAAPAQAKCTIGCKTDSDCANNRLTDNFGSNVHTCVDGLCSR